MCECHKRSLRSFHRCEFRKFAKVAISPSPHSPFFQRFTIGTAIAIAESVTPATGYSGSKTFKDRDNVQELSYGTDNRMAKSVFVGQVYTNAGANHQQ
jgi:hypothetical protein